MKFVDKRNTNHNKNPNLDSSKVLKIRNHAKNEQHSYPKNDIPESNKHTLQYLKTSIQPVKTMQSINKEIEKIKNAIMTLPAESREERKKLLKELVELYEEQEKLKLKEKQNRSIDNNDLSK